MAQVFRVRVPFARIDPVTGQQAMYAKGDLVTHPLRVADIRGSEHSSFGHMTWLADDHPAVLPHLPEDHPARVAYVAMVEAGQEKPDPELRTEHAE